MNYTLGLHKLAVFRARLQHPVSNARSLCGELDSAISLTWGEAMIGANSPGALTPSMSINIPACNVLIGDGRLVNMHPVNRRETMRGSCSRLRFPLHGQDNCGPPARAAGYALPGPWSGPASCVDTVGDCAFALSL